MPEKNVEVPGLGIVSFPDNMSDDQINSAIQAQLSGKQEQPSTYSHLTAGYNPNVEEWAQKHPIAGPIVRFLDSTGGAAMATPEATMNFIKDLTSGAYRELKGEKNVSTPTSEALISGIKGWADPNVRKSAISLLPEALGQGVGSVAAGEAVGAAAPVLPAKLKAALPEDLGAKLRDPETNQIKPGVKLAIKVGTGTAGHFIGMPGVGEFGGYFLGGDLADAMIPDHPTYIKNKLFATEGKPVSITKSPNFDPAAYKAGAAERTTQPTPAAPSNPFPTATSTNPLETAAMPSRSLPTTPAGSVSGLPEAAAVRTTPFPARFVSKFETPETAPAEVSPQAQDLISRNQRVVKPGEMPTAEDLKRAGDYTQIPALKLKALKRFGDRLAALELTRRGIND